MSITRFVARGTTRLLAGLFAAKALDFTFYLLLARTLGVEQFGRYTFALSFTLLFNVITDLGVNTVITREAARRPGAVRQLLGTASVVKLLLAAATVVATLAIAAATRAPAATVGLIGIFTAAMLLNSTAMLFESLLKAAGRPGMAGLSIIAQSTTALVVGATLVLSGFAAIGGAWAYLAAAFVHAVAAAWWSRDQWMTPPRTGDRVSAAAVWSLIRDAAPLALSGVFIAVYFRMDSVLLNVMQGPQAVGLYGGAYRLFEGMVLISAAYRSVLFPVMARAADGPAEALAVLCRKSLRLHLIFTIGVAAYMTLQAKAVISLVLGPSYAPAAVALALLMWALPGAYMADTLLHLLAAQRRQNVSARAVAITAVLNVVLNLALIPKLSIVGAAIATVASEFVSFGLMFLAFRERVPGLGLLRTMRAPVVSGAIAMGVMAVGLRWAPDGPLGMVVVGLLGAVAYVSVLVRAGALGRKDLEVLNEVPAALGLSRSPDASQPSQLP